MKRILRLRHWQLFLISWGPLTTFFILLFIRPISVGYTLLLWIIVFPVALVNSFIWVWSLVTCLIPTIAQGERPKIKLFKICFWIPTIYIFYILCFTYFNFFVRKVASVNPELELKIHMGLTILSILCIIYGLSFAARTLKTAELQRNLKIHEYLPELALMILTPIGMWNIQPRLNKIAGE